MPRTSRPPSPLRAVFGANLRAARKEQELTVFDVAHACRMDWSYIHQIERGERNAGLDILDALAQAVNRRLIDLLDEGANGAEKTPSIIVDIDYKVHASNRNSLQNLSGGKIRSLRKEKYPDLNGKEFCDLVLDRTGLKITPSTLSRLEAGVRKVSDKELKDFAVVLGVSIDCLSKA